MGTRTDDGAHMAAIRGEARNDAAEKASLDGY